MSVILGKDVALKISVDGDLIAVGCATSVLFEFVNELIGKTDRNAGLWRKKRVRISDCHGSVQGVTMSNSTATRLSPFYMLQEAIMRRELACEFQYTDTQGNDKVIAGNFLIQSLSLNADTNAFTDFDIQLEGTGGVDVTDANLPEEFTCPDVLRDTWTLAEGATTISGTGDVFSVALAGKRAVAVYREGDEYDLIESTPGNRQAWYNGTTVTFLNAGNPGGEKVFLILEDV